MTQGWAIVGPDGKIGWSVLGLTERLAWLHFNLLHDPFRNLEGFRKEHEADGYRAVRVEVRVIDNEKETT